MAPFPDPAYALPSIQLTSNSHQADNQTVCTFIRSTLAMNVLPFVQHRTSAKGLYKALIHLYGEDAGIDRVGGPAVFGALALDMAF
jgi:hypothetical protein